jgi:hypothetical protein
MRGERKLREIKQVKKGGQWGEVNKGGGGKEKGKFWKRDVDRRRMSGRGEEERERLEK